MKYDRPELLDRLAAEYVFGLMSARVRRRFQAIQRTLPAAQQAVQTWEQLFTPLARSVPPEQPSATAWEAIDRRVGGQASSPVAMASDWRAWLRLSSSIPVATSHCTSRSGFAKAIHRARARLTSSCCARWISSRGRFRDERTRQNSVGRKVRFASRFARVDTVRRRTYPAV